MTKTPAKKRWKPRKDDRYWIIEISHDGLSVYGVVKGYQLGDESQGIRIGNYFPTRKKAQAMSKKIKKILRDG